MTPDDLATSEGERRRSLQVMGLLVCSCLSVVVGVCVAVGVFDGDEAAAVCVSQKINPNTAPVGSLIRLPGIGLTRAHAIAAHRDAVRQETAGRVAFHRHNDLQEIRGIGPKTAADIARWLQFDSGGPDGFVPSDVEPPHPFPFAPIGAPIPDVPNARRD